ncbi:MAG: hypothetical protein M3509_10400 [Chloroflexota bacterium]|nr:hypothetical protein [Chloroflexota bacterium]
MQDRKDFQPHIIEVTRSLDLSGLSEEAATKLRQESSVQAEPSILTRVLGGQEALASSRIIIEWAKWLQFVQSTLIAASDAGRQFAGPKATDELTTRYRVEPR